VLAPTEIGEPCASIAPNLRQRKGLLSAVSSVRDAAENLKQKTPLEIVALELSNGVEELGKIIGETADAALLDSIFSRFCIGK
jgi:tRNA modification GTPase